MLLMKMSLPPRAKLLCTNTVQVEHQEWALVMRVKDPQASILELWSNKTILEMLKVIISSSVMSPLDLLSWHKAILASERLKMSAKVTYHATNLEPMKPAITAETQGPLVSLLPLEAQQCLE